MTYFADDAGVGTVEAALGLAALLAVLVLCLAGITAVSAQVRCIDAAREAARLAARGDDLAAVGIVHRLAPAGAAMQLRRDGQFVVAVVKVRPYLLPSVDITATGVATAEPLR